MKFMSQILSLLFAIALLCTCLPKQVAANEVKEAMVDTLSVTVESADTSILSNEEISEVSGDDIDQNELIIFDSLQEAKDFIRDGIINRTFDQNTETSVTGTVGISASAVEDRDTLSIDISDYIYLHTGNPKGGDYLSKHGSYVTIDVSTPSADNDYFTINISCHYRFTHEQDRELDEAVEQLLAELNIESASDYEKVRAIYDWMCLNITYDFSYTYYDAYGALCKRTAVCNGYGVLFYRLCLEVGVDCRYCGGYAFDSWGVPQGHGWNVVQVDGAYYYVDTTWGAGLINGEVDYYYFLKGIDGLADHLIVPSRWEDEIGDYCTVAEEDYPIPEKEIVLANGYLSETIAWSITRTGTLTITGTGELVDYYYDWGYGEYVKEIIIGEGITSIGRSMFSTMQAARIILPDSLTSIAKNALPGGITSIDLPKNLEILAPGALPSAVLNSITIDPENPYYTTVGNCLFTKDLKTLVCYAGIIDENSNLIQEYQIPEGVETIGACAFENQNILYEITLPDSLKYIEYSAFFQCTYANIELTDSIVSIADAALGDCHSITSFYIGKNVEHIGEYALGSSRLENIECHPDNQYYTCVDGVLFSMDMTKLILYPASRKDTSYEIPDGVIEIAPAAFAGFESSVIQGANLETVSFPDSLVVIGENAFEGQVHIKCLHLPDNLETIEYHAFAGLTCLNQIIIPDSVKTIGFQAFGGHGAEIIVIGKNVETIADGAFTRGDYPSQNNYAEIKVYFRGAPPAVNNLGCSYIFFGYDPEGANSTRVLATVYYPEELTHLWAPNGETEWDPFPDVDFPTAYKIYPGEAPDTTYVQAVIAPTCTESGYSIHTCTVCGDNYVTDKTEALGHKYETTYVEPTCEDPGGNMHTCTVCGDSYMTDRVEALSHNYKTTFLEPTCEEPGGNRHTCTVCGSSYITDEVEALGHTYESVVTEATCKKPGGIVHTCTVCGHSYMDVETNPLGHTFEDGFCTVCGEPDILLGDVNGDGNINILDANLAAAYYNEVIDLTEDQILAADVNGDGNVNILDANLIAAYYNEVIDAFPAEN